MRSERIADPRRGALGVYLVAALLVLAGSAVLYPGWLSFDAANHLHQAVHGDYSDLQPPAYAAFWGLLLRLGLPPGALLVVVLAALEFALAGLAVAIGLRGPRAVALLLVPAWPPFLVLCGHLWTDVALVALLALAFALGSAGSRGGRLAALLALVGACAVRHNALAAVLVLAWWLAGRETTRLRRRIVLALGALVLAGGSAQFVNRALTVQHQPAWTPTALWDLAAASVARNDILLPPDLIGDGMSVDQLAGALDCETVLTLLTGTRSGINAGIVTPLPEATLAELRRRWLALPLTAPGAYLAHRACVATALFGPQAENKPEALILVPTVIERPENPPMARNDTAANGGLVAWMRAHRGAWFVAPLLPILLGLAALVVARRRSLADEPRALIDALVLSGLAYAASLLPLAPAAEYRYVFWPMFSGALAFVVALLIPAAGFQEPSRRLDRDDARSDRIPSRSGVRSEPLHLLHRPFAIRIFAVPFSLGGIAAAYALVNLVFGFPWQGIAGKATLPWLGTFLLLVALLVYAGARVAQRVRLLVIRATTNDS